MKALANTADAVRPTNNMALKDPCGDRRVVCRASRCGPDARGTSIPRYAKAQQIKVAAPSLTLRVVICICSFGVAVATGVRYIQPGAFGNVC
jgi:hypothetical protein